MESLTNTTQTEVVTPPSKVLDAIYFQEVARSKYRHHTRVAKFYMRRTAIIMGVNLVCTAIPLFGGPKLLLVISVVASLVLLLRKVEGDLAFHLQAAIEYQFSISDFENSENTNALQKAITLFEQRCQEYDPCYTSTRSTRQMS